MESIDRTWIYNGFLNSVVEGRIRHFATATNIPELEIQIKMGDSLIRRKNNVLET